jgi:hypothetical protein
VNEAERSLAVGLAGGRIAIGVSILAAPRLAMRVLGFDPDDTAALTLSRLAGIRDIALGVEGVAAANSSDQRRERGILIAGTVCDAVDAMAFSGALRAGHRQAGVFGTLTAASAAALGAYLTVRS